MIFGNMGNFLKIDLSTGEIKQNNLNEDLYFKYLGGYGINNKLYYDFRVPKIDPLE